MVAEKTYTSASFSRHGGGGGGAEVRWLITRKITALPSCYHLEVIQGVDALPYMTNLLS